MDFGTSRQPTIGSLVFVKGERRTRRPRDKRRMVDRFESLAGFFQRRTRSVAKKKAAKKAVKKSPKKKAAKKTAKRK